METKTYVFIVNFLIVEDGDKRHENYVFSTLEKGKNFFSEMIEKERKIISKYIARGVTNNWIEDEYETNDSTTIEFFEEYNSNSNHVIITLEKKELN